MITNPSRRSYLRAAVQEASPAGLVVILYDLLVDDLQGAIGAIRSGAIEERSRHLKHALLVLQFLEGGLNLQEGAAAGRSLSAFYAHLRRQMVAAQIANDDSILARQIALVLEVREAWRTVDARPAVAAASISSAPPSREEGDLNPPESFRWSA